MPLSPCRPALCAVRTRLALCAVRIRSALCAARIRPEQCAARSRRAPWCRGAAGSVTAAMLVALAAGAVVSLAGCAKFDSALSQQEIVVQFADGTSQAARLKARAGCSHISGARVEALPKDHLLVDQLYDVRYQVGGASDGDVAKLEACLQHFPGVVGFESNGAGGT